MTGISSLVLDRLYWAFAPVRKDCQFACPSPRAALAARSSGSNRTTPAGRSAREAIGARAWSSAPRLLDDDRHSRFDSLDLVQEYRPATVRAAQLAQSSRKALLPASRL